MPPIAAVGLSEAEARRRGLVFRINAASTPDWFTARRLAERVYGHKVLIEEHSDLVLGAHLVGPGADEVINLANEQCEKAESSDEVIASLLYASARFNAFLIAATAQSAADIQSGKDDAVAYFTEQYRQLLQDNLDDYIENFDEYNA